MILSRLQVSRIEENWWKEWSKAREIIDSCETRVQEARKVGFSLVSALLTAGSLLGGKLDEVTQSRAALPFSITCLALLVGIAVTEKQAMITLSAAATRCRFLEALSSVELTEAISHRFGMDRWHGYTLVFYALFGLAAALIGLALSTGEITSLAILAFSFTYFAVLTRLYTLRPRSGPGPDLFLDRVECRVGEYITIAVMNHADESQPLLSNVVEIQHVLDLDGHRIDPKPKPDTLELPNCPATADCRLDSYRAVTWMWTPKAPGVYCINFPSQSHGILSDRHDKTIRKMMRVKPRSQSAKKCGAQ